MNNLKNKIIKSVDSDIVNIDEAINANLNPYFDKISNISKYSLFSGGKRLRPLLMILIARLCGYTKNNITHYSTIFEYLHTATLLHDDIIDNAKLRRNKTAANHIWNYPTAVLTGDFLLSKALLIATETKLHSIIILLTKIIEEMSQGEIQQLEKKKT